MSTPSDKTVPSSVVLCIMDGVGWGRRDDGDAVALAETPTLDDLRRSGSWRLLKAHGTAVGLPSDDDMGNSEVGHNAMGAGRVFDQGAKLVDDAVRSGRIFEGDTWRRATEGGTLHLMGLVSDGNVHSHIDHLRALVERAPQDGVRRLRVHVLTDGRDVDGRSALTWVRPLEEQLAGLDIDAAIASGGGRMHITMDRYEADWEMVARGWRTHVHAEGRRFDSASEAIETLYAEDSEVDDQTLPAFVVGDYAGMEDGDAVIFFNFRGDRAIEISRAFDEDTEEFDRTCFDRGRRPDVRYAGMMEYDGDTHVPAHYLVAPPSIDRTVGDYLAAAGKRVLAVSETQKFGHVTYFFNGNRSEPLNGEDRVQIDSDRISFDRKPAMKAEEITDRVVQAIRRGEHDQIRLNLANGDMVGHTGKLAATVAAMGTVDDCVGRILSACEEAGAVLLVTADHGNADEMFRWDSKRGAYAVDEEGRRVVSPSHSKNPVPVALFDPTGTFELVGEDVDEVIGGIAQLGATLLDLSGLRVPDDYLPSLVRRR